MTQTAESGGRTVVNFDHHSEEFRARPTEILHELRSTCPVTWSEAYGGFWVATGYHAVTTAARDAETFTSWKDVPVGSGPRVGQTFPGLNPAFRQGFAEMDGPMHQALRRRVMGWFTSRATDQLRPEVQRYTTWCMDQIIESGRAELVDALVGPVPALLSLRMLGLPMKDWRRFAEVAHKAFYTVPGTPEFSALAETHAWLDEQMGAAISARREQPTDDLISAIANARYEGELLPMDDAMGCVQLLLFGGVDTTTNLLASALMYLDEDHEARSWLREDLSRLPRACEEFLRLFTPSQGLARTVMEPCALGGQQLALHDVVWLGWSAAKRDPEVFDDPDVAKLDRFPNRHTTFGVGPHRCLGAPTARMMFEIVMAEVLTRIPEYTIDRDRAERFPSIGQMNGWTAVPATFPAGPRVGFAADAPYL